MEWITSLLALSASFLLWAGCTEESRTAPSHFRVLLVLLGGIGMLMAAFTMPAMHAVLRAAVSMMTGLVVGGVLITRKRDAVSLISVQALTLAVQVLIGVSMLVMMLTVMITPEQFHVTIAGVPRPMRWMGILFTVLSAGMMVVCAVPLLLRSEQLLQGLPLYAHGATALLGVALAGLGLTFALPVLILMGGFLVGAGVRLAYLYAAHHRIALLPLLQGRIVLMEQQGTLYSLEEGVHYCQVSAEEAGYAISKARTLLVVPGAGLAASGSAHTLMYAIKQWQARGIIVHVVMHPAAGYTSGQMVLLMEQAGLPLSQMISLEKANEWVTQVDVVVTVGASDIVHLSALDTHSPLYGMPVIHAYQAPRVIALKRSLQPGASHITNPLWYRPHTWMVLGELEEMLKGMC